MIGGDGALLEPVQAFSEKRTQVFHQFHRGFGRVAVGVEHLLQVFLDQLHAFGFVADGREPERTLDGVDRPDQIAINVGRPSLAAAGFDPVVDGFKMIVDLLDHQLDQRRVKAFEFGQVAFLADSGHTRKQCVDVVVIEIGGFAHQRGSKARQRLDRFTDQLDHLFGRVLAVQGLVEQLLDFPRKFADALCTGHPAGTLEGMERAPDVGDQRLVVRLLAPFGIALLERRQFLVEFLEENGHQVEIVAVER